MNHPLLLFSIFLILIDIVYRIFGKNYALDIPDKRKIHSKIIPQIGGIIFGPIFLLLVGYFNIAPTWYLICAFVSILLGAIDDRFHLRWIIKLLVQLIILIYISSIYWDKILYITFYNYNINISQILLFLIFMIWFIGIYNAVNLIDGLDGLAGGFMIIITFSLSFINLNSNLFSDLNFILSIGILAFLVYNQRPAKLFMGDAGSLLLGFHLAVLPLLFFDSFPNSNILQITPFTIIVFFLVADTSRVFFTRIINKQNPMSADTIHFHHIIIKESGSYLASIAIIYSISLFSSWIGIISIQNTLSNNIMIIHLTLILLFVLVPPLQSYVPLIKKFLINPIYSREKNKKYVEPNKLRTFSISFILIGLFLSLSMNYNFSDSLEIPEIIGLLLLLLFILSNWNKKHILYVLQTTVLIIISKMMVADEISIFTKLFTTFLLIFVFVFSIENRFGLLIREFSSLDILSLLITSGSLIIYLFGYPINLWKILVMFVTWFSMRFIFYRTYFNLF